MLRTCLREINGEHNNYEALSITLDADRVNVITLREQSMCIWTAMHQTSTGN